jgi:hypothetical protein
VIGGQPLPGWISAHIVRAAQQNGRASTFTRLEMLNRANGIVKIAHCNSICGVAKGHRNGRLKARANAHERRN